MSGSRNKCLYLSLGLLLVLLTACTASEVTPTSTATSAPLPATPTTSLTITPTALPEATPSPTATALPPTATPMPKLPPLAAGLVYSIDDRLWRVTGTGEVMALDLPANVPYQVALSPDGTEAIHTVYGGGKHTLLWKDILTGEQQRLPDVAEWIVQFPVWWVARPGWLIVGGVETEVQAYGYLSIMRADGSDFQILDADEMSSAFPAPSPDGDAIAYDRRGEPWIYHWGRGPEPLDLTEFGFTPGEYFAIGSPSWSPDGTRLAWVVGDELRGDGVWRIGILLLDLERRTHDILFDYEPAGRGGWPPAPVWSPDGHWLAFQVWFQVVGEEGSTRLVRVDDKADIRALGYGKAVWSPDGRYLAYAGEDGLRVAAVATWESQLLLPSHTRPPLLGPEPVAWFAPTTASPFLQTEAWLAEMTTGGGHPDAATLQQLAEALCADTLAYLDAAIATDVPLAEQQPTLARMAADLPGREGGQVLPVDLDPGVETELVIGVGIGGAPLLYAYSDGGNWQVMPVPWPDNMEVDPNLWPGAVEAQDLTGDGLTELLATYGRMGGSGYWDYLQVLRRTAENFILLFRADLLSWAGESRYTLEPDPTQAGVMQIVLTYPHLYSLGFDHKLVNHPLGRQVWRWDAGVGRYVLAETAVDLEHSGWGAEAEVTVEDRLRWLVNEGETRFRQGDYEAALPWYAQVVLVAKAEGWQPANKEPHWPAFASFRRAQLLLMIGQIDEGRAAMQPIANSWPGDPLSALAQAFLDGYGEGGADAAERAFEAMRSAVNLEDHFYNDRPGLLRFPMDAEGILFSGVVPSPPTWEWPRAGTFD
ncbi:MAG: hypothetical protein ACP5J4_06645 [Anaerolineae bacterium]